MFTLGETIEMLTVWFDRYPQDKAAYMKANHHQQMAFLMAVAEGMLISTAVAFFFEPATTDQERKVS